MSTRLEIMARRVAEDPSYLAHVLARYADDAALSEEGLRAELLCSPDDFTRLRLCRRPRPEQFAADVDLIAERCHADADVLLLIIRHVDSLEAIGGSGRGTLLAARDREEDGE